MIRVEQDGAVTILTLDRPEARNALSLALTLALEGVLDDAEVDDATRVVLLRGAGGDFAAGADLKEMLPLTEAEVRATDFSGCCPRLGRMTKPVVVAVDGYALGGGCELVEMCDIVIAADNAWFGHPEITVGTMPGAGGSQRLPRTVGKHKAMDLLLTGRRMDAAEAERCGLVSRVVPAERLMDEALGVARRLAGLSPAILAMVKQSVLRAFEPGLKEGLAFERRQFHRTFATHDRREGMAAFVERRPARFIGA
ncbi:enoyl-CoA hydratase-related protein [Magnetospirillum sp. 15-1]|uniref:enoyl-CoA hydratase-related protein n=1 Tax=Magnetospirillum sp. 15-1 TaxID=1979370 RepID=UPI000BBBE92F|nr:enoyl-CoA hydratase-related protein [Magnetospirillum sp. 15-1]